MIKNKKVKCELDYSGKEPEFYMHIDFDEIDKYLLSIPSRDLSNRNSGISWDSNLSGWVRWIDGVRLTDIYGKNKDQARKFHRHFDKHIESLAISGKNFALIGNGNLGNNPGFLSWEHDKEKKVYCLADEPFFSREEPYTCFAVPRDLKEDKPNVKKVRFNRLEDLLGEAEENISENVDWCTFGYQIVDAGNGVNVGEVIKNGVYDARHVLDLRDYGEKAKKDIPILNEIYRDYPREFNEKILELMKTIPRAEYLHSILGVDKKGIVISHLYGKFEDIALRLIDKGVKDAVILDQGGSVGAYLSWLYPNGGYINAIPRFRPERVSTIAFVLKD